MSIYFRWNNELWILENEFLQDAWHICHVSKDQPKNINKLVISIQIIIVF